MDLGMKIENIIKEHFAITDRSIDHDSNFIEELNLDSLDLVEFVLNIESTFETELDANVSKNIRSINDLVKVLNQANSAGKLGQNTLNQG
jgi:acyl carrier protein